MDFDVGKFIDSFAASFGHVVDWMLADEYGHAIRADLQVFRDRKNELGVRPDSSDALRLLVELIVTNAWYYKRPRSFDPEIDSFIAKYQRNFRTEEAINELINLVDRVSPLRMRSQARESIRNILESHRTLREFTEELYDLARHGKSMVLGEKGRDNYLRDFGYWDRIPMDRHEWIDTR